MNAGLYYYRDYWNGADSDLPDLNSKLYEYAAFQYINKPILGNILSLYMTTTYPGLLFGGGYNHQRENKEDKVLKLGFFFDHSTGLPCITGSAVKGTMLKGCEEWAYLKEILPESISNKLGDTGEEFCRVIFGTQDFNPPINYRVIFFDAFVTSEKNILGDDYITAHKHDNDTSLDQFTEPNPVKFLKILPDVNIEFDFQIPKSIKIGEEEFSNLEIREIFQIILLEFGIGAKRNVGYGYLNIDRKNESGAMKSNFPKGDPINIELYESNDQPLRGTITHLNEKYISVDLGGHQLPLQNRSKTEKAIEKVMRRKPNRIYEDLVVGLKVNVTISPNEESPTGWSIKIMPNYN